MVILEVKFLKSGLESQNKALSQSERGRMLPLRDDPTRRHIGAVSTRTRHGIRNIVGSP